MTPDLVAATDQLEELMCRDGATDRLLEPGCWSLRPTEPFSVSERPQEPDLDLQVPERTPWSLTRATSAALD